ncbi:MAG: hypothetical protein DCC50_05610 [Acidobacteria bacterium]|nr:MAG: hypothetical protein DCC50_05610 [Acidobacteriota bacterium]
MSRRTTIGRQIAWGYATCMAALVLVTVIATLSLQDVAGTKDRVIEQRFPLVAGAHQLEAAAAAKSTAARGHMLTGEESYLARVGELDAQFEQLLAGLRTGTAEAQGAAERLASVDAADDAWDEVLAEVTARRDGERDLAQVAAEFERDVAPAYESLQSSLSTLVNEEERLIAADMQESGSHHRDALIVLWGLSLLTLVWVCAMAAWLIRRIRQRLSHVALQLGAASQEILAGVRQQVSGAAEQAAAVQQTVATVDELVQTAEQAVDRARTVTTRAQESVSVAGLGTRAVEDTGAGMEELRAQVHGISERITETARQAQSIGEVVATVDGIAAETHILALNATIEAARAGEHGRGFTVVAQEVKNLAAQSRAATNRVAAILGEIEQGSTSAVMATEEGTRGTDAVAELVARAGASIRDLSEVIASAAVAAEQIAASSRQQAAATRQISEAMRNVDIVMEQNVAAARQSEQTVQELDDAARRLQELVGVPVGGIAAG